MAVLALADPSLMAVRTEQHRAGAARADIDRQQVARRSQPERRAVDEVAQRLARRRTGAISSAIISAP